MKISFRDLQLIYEYGTTVRIKSTGEWATILGACWCCNALPLHYEAWISEKKGRLQMVYQKEIELISLPYIETPEERRRSIDTLGEIIANLVLRWLEEEQSTKTANEKLSDGYHKLGL